ncbi:MAG: AbrB/MazE/SpoVT family DNA-binding domain-containing protein [candidate division KSB1 bacterium]|nr:AbrB/MazE/SpoVT family DNA-binding domain-containing protein [candidate division KSB1 bacterium]MDZ7342215.1 AbrB/MazE/SpoVT family DNA-binding domain-containing protein [candidate division KSB1 bacterium]
MEVQIQKWGNSLALRIPKSFAKQIKIEQGSYVDLSAVDGKLIAKPLEEHEYSLEQLLSGITDQNIHAEFDTGKAVGKESW